MGRSFRSRPKRLGAKLKLIRMRLELTQEQMIEKLGVKDEPLRAASISAYEKNLREPPLIVLLRYARVFGCTMEDLVDDTIKLPGAN
jgi:transcriptional regulator with XRE-family HTH domain